MDACLNTLNDELCQVNTRVGHIARHQAEMGDYTMPSTPVASADESHYSPHPLLPATTAHTHCHSHHHHCPQSPLPTTKITNKNKPKIKSQTQTQTQNQTIKLIPSHHQPPPVHHKKPSNKYPPPPTHHKSYPSRTKSQTHQNMPKLEPKV